jgi:membrane protein implicated in regulation of membrane protease activity
MSESLLIFSLSSYHITLILWGVLIIVSLIVELITEELTIIWGTIGAIFSFLAAIFKAEIWLQLLIFIVFTTLTIIIFRPIIKKIAKKEMVRTNADRIIGMVAVVTEPFKNNEVGRVVVNGQSWRATSTSFQEFFEGEKVQVEGISGTKVIISKINNEKIIRL